MYSRKLSVHNTVGLPAGRVGFRARSRDVEAEEKIMDPTHRRAGHEGELEGLRRLEVLYSIRKALVHYWGAEGLVYSVKNRVYRLRDLAHPRPELLGLIPWSPFELLGHIRLADRALKASILQVHDVGGRLLLVENGHSRWTVAPGGAVELISSFPRTRPMNRGICTSVQGVTYVADYLANTDRRVPIRIHRTKDLKRFEVAWEFPPGDIRHVHAVIPDPEDQRRLWVLTGDTDPESRILFTDDGFATLRTFLADGQRTRATDLVIRNGRLIWGMDSPETTSSIVSADKNGPGEISPWHELPGPAYYMTRNRAGGVYIGTTAEPGAGVHDRAGHLFGLLPDQTWSEVLRRRKDHFPQHGIFYLPRGVLPDNYLVYSQRALHPQEGRMIVARDRGWAPTGNTP